jgi:hypothetical protein
VEVYCMTSPARYVREQQQNGQLCDQRIKGHGGPGSRARGRFILRSDPFWG